MTSNLGNMTRRSFMGMAATVAGLSMAACGASGGEASAGGGSEITGTYKRFVR